MLLVHILISVGYVSLLSHRISVQICLQLLSNSFPKWLNQFTVQPAIFKSLNFSTSLHICRYRLLVCCFNFCHSYGYMFGFYSTPNFHFPDDY